MTNRSGEWEIPLTWRDHAIVAGWWLLSRVVVMAVVVGAASYRNVPGETHPYRDGNWLLDRFAFWDSFHFLRVAEDGYFAPDRTCCDQAYFPAYPMLIRALGPVFGGSFVAAGIVISVVASTVAAVALWRLILLRTGRRDLARWGVVAFGAAPHGVFLVSVYAESLFIAGAVLAWLFAVRRQWWWAGAAAALACTTRINGAFLVLALGVLYLTQVRADRRWVPRSDILAFGLPAFAVGGYVVWLHEQTGSWTAYRDAQLKGWGRSFHWPWESYPAMWQALLDSESKRLQVMGGIDLAVMVATVALIGWLAWRRAWPEFTYVTVSWFVIATSPSFGGAGRYALAWFPAYLVLADLAGRRRGRAVTWGFVLLGLLLMPIVTTWWGLRWWAG